MSMVTTKDVFGAEHQVEASQLIWRPSAYGIIFKDDTVLMVPQFKSKYDLPGGGVAVGEKIEAAVAREVYEETGLTVKVIRLVGVEQNFFSSVHDKAETQHYNSLLFYYLCEYVSGSISTDGFDDEEVNYAQAAEWVSMQKLDSIEPASTFDFRPLIKQAAKGDL